LPNGSKDLSDSLAGVVYGLTMRREVWGSFNIPLVMIPESIRAVIDKKKENVKEGTKLETEAA